MGSGCHVQRFDGITNGKARTVRIARFSTDGGDPRFGIVDGDEIVVLAGDPMFQGFETVDVRVPLVSATRRSRHWRSLK